MVSLDFGVPAKDIFLRGHVRSGNAEQTFWGIFGMIYGDPGTIFSLGIYTNSSADSFTLSVPGGLVLARQTTLQTQQPFTGHWLFSGATGLVSTSTGLASPVSLSVLSYDGAQTAFAAGVLTLNITTFLRSTPLGLDFGTTSDVNTTETPHRLRFSFRGTAPIGGLILMEVFAWNRGRMYFNGHWDGGRMEVGIQRGGQVQSFISTGTRTAGIEQLLEVEYVDNPGGPGGTLTFYIDGQNAGGPFATTIKPRIPADVSLYSNASLDNTRNSVDGLQVRELMIGYDGLVSQVSYTPVLSGAISRADLEALVVDARSVTMPQPPVTLSYQAEGGTVTTLDVTIGPLTVPVGQAFKAVLFDWSTGSGVRHPNELVMTRIINQNCCFQDSKLYGAQSPWIECLPQGPVPNIAGINYYCEAIRSDDYVQFQFGYDWDTATMAANPFGDPSGKHSYMVPHKWLIYDSANTLLATIQTPDLKPLNGNDKPALFEGSYDGRGCAITTSTNKWYPHGTVRSGIIWRNHDPVQHDATTIKATVPLLDVSIPFGSHTDFSVNGFDLRIYAGGAGNDGQANGFGNTRMMNWDQSDYATMAGKVGVTSDPYKASLYSANSLTANAAVWLRYTPFNIQGRSPITGPGGLRDDRQIMHEMVVNFANTADILRVRPHDRRPYRDISLAVLTGYVSDPIHCFEQGRNVPLYKGNARRPIVMRNHYYGPGYANVPEAQAYYVQGGRLSDLVTNVSPLRVNTPFAGDTPTTPYFGTAQIDKSHAHQFPGWGTIIFKTPEFAFLGHKFWDQNRLYSNNVIGDDYAQLWGTRDGAWAFMHTALAWKTASANSSRLYSRAEVMDFIVYDFEYFYNKHYAATPGFLYPPTNVMVNGNVGDVLASYAAAPLFGPCVPGGLEVTQQDFQIGYWLTALAAAEKLGFNAALRQASTKAAAVLDWMIALHRKRVIGRLVTAPNLNPARGLPYVTMIWSQEQIIAANGNVAALPQTYAALAAVAGQSTNWDSYVFEGHTMSRDGQAMDQLLAAPSMLRYMLNQTGSDINAAQTAANTRRNAKKADELAKGVDAGSGWFWYLQASHNPAKSVQS